MKLAVVVPTRLALRPGGLALRDHGPELWLDGALASVRRQALYTPSCWETYVGADPGAPVPIHVFDHAHVVRGRTHGQAAAVTAAADLAVSRGADVLLFLEDDDLWRPCKATVQLPYLNQAPFVSCSQRLLSESGEVLGANDYPVPSGWMMEAGLWSRVGGFDLGLRWLVDTDWLGRLNDLRVRRLHLIPSGDTHSPNKLGFVSRHSEVVKCGEHAFLVDRTANESGGMATIANQVGAGAEADEEAASLRRRFGCDPW